MVYSVWIFVDTKTVTVIAEIPGGGWRKEEGGRKEGRTNEGEARAGRKKPRSADTRGISFKTGGGLREEGEEARRKEGEGGLPKSPEKEAGRKE